MGFVWEWEDAWIHTPGILDSKVGSPQYRFPANECGFQAIAAAAFGLMVKYVLTALCEHLLDSRPVSRSYELLAVETSPYPWVIKCIPVHNDSMWSSLAVGIIIVEQICELKILRSRSALFSLMLVY